MGNRNKTVKQKEYAYGKKTPKNIENPDGFLKKNPSWAFQRCDFSHEKWSIKNCEAFCDDILEKLVSFEGQTWAEIMKASGGKKNGTNNHYENISSLSKDAQKRIEELKLDVDQLFSLRLTGKIRLYGTLLDGIFNMLWYDPEHEISPSTKKHT